MAEVGDDDVGIGVLELAGNGDELFFECIHSYACQRLEFIGLIVNAYHMLTVAGVYFRIVDSRLFHHDDNLRLVYLPVCPFYTH